MRKKPSELIRQHIGRMGSGFELDDLMSRKTGDPYEGISRKIVKIHQRFKTNEYPIGTSNPASYQSLEELAAELERSGL